MGFYRKLSVILLSLLYHPLLSQQLRFKQITGEEGLSTNLVRCIMQDDKGFMWFGTQDGLNKYDGYGIKVFKHDPTNVNSLSNSDITVLTQVRPNLILIGTSSGVNFFDPVTEKFYSLNRVDGRLERKINAILPIDSANALVGAEEGLFILNFPERTIKNPFFKSGEDVIISCLGKVDGVVYVGTAGKGLWKLNTKNGLEKVELQPADYIKLKPEAYETITSIDQYGSKMYLGTDGYGILKVDRNHEIETVISFRNLNQNTDFIKDFFIKNNRIYAATLYGTVVHNLISEKTTHYTRQETAYSLSANACNCILNDDQNNIWIGTDLGGVSVSFFRSQKFPVSGLKYETEFRNIYAFCEIKRGTVLIGGQEILHELDLETGASTPHNKFLGNNTVLCIERESDNIFWIGTWGGGVFRYDKSAKKAQNFLDNKIGGTVLTLKISGEHIYAGTLGDGLFRMSLKTFDIARFTDKEGLPVKSINSIFVDSKNKAWLGTYNGGLVKLNGLGSGAGLNIETIFKSNGKPGEIASNAVYGINEDNKGHIWVATSGGLSKLLPDGTFYNFYEKDGLANGFLHAIMKDSIGNFWVSSNGGITRFNPVQPEKEILFRNYSTKDGLVNTSHHMGAAHSAPSGMMYFGGDRGFNAFRPAAIKDNFHIPQVYVTGYKRSGKDVVTDSAMPYKKFIELEWSDNFFQFEFVALDFTDPARNKFRYMLEGLNKDWSEPTNIRYVSYTGLPGGKYVFKVKAANNDGVWNERPHEIRITVVPPFWKTKAFYVLVGLIGLGMIVAYTQYRTRAIKRENRILEKKVAERTRELEEKNRDILSSIQYARRIQEAILPSRDHIFKKLKKTFILYRPKDIVSGDFYWFAEKKGVKIFAVVDCTGHGVPGAFMSMIGHNLLHQIVLDKEITDPGEILTHLHQGVVEALRQGDNEVDTNDGMDVSIICINDDAREVKWAGANRPLVLINANGEFFTYDGNKFAIGGTQSNVERKFDTHEIPIHIASMAYLFSDGYADQFGGEKGKKFMVKRFHEILTNIHKFSADQQQKELENNFDKWRMNHEQVDDVLIVGIEI